MKHSFLITIVLFLLCYKNANSKQFSSINQDSINKKSVVVYLNQPFGLFDKIRVKVGYKPGNKNTYLLSFTNFNRNFMGEVFKGIQVCSEYQYLLKANKREELFIYGKAGFGNYDYTFQKFELFESHQSERYGKGNYLLFGVGFGQELFLRKSKQLTLQFNEGFRLFNVIQFESKKPNYVLFSPIRPASIIEININLGYRF